MAVFVAPAPVSTAGLGNHLVQAITTVAPGEILAVHAHQAQQFRRQATAMGQRGKGGTTAHKAPAAGATQARLQRITYRRQYQRLIKVCNCPVTGQCGQLLTQSHQVISFLGAGKKKSIQHLIEQRHPSRQWVCARQCLVQAD